MTAKQARATFIPLACMKFMPIFTGSRDSFSKSYNTCKKSSSSSLRSSWMIDIWMSSSSALDAAASPYLPVVSIIVASEAALVELSASDATVSSCFDLRLGSIMD